MTKQATKAQRARWSKVLELGCIVKGCYGTPFLHHALTGAGRRKDHDKVLPLCHYHHQGEQGIHTLSRRVWEPLYGTEQYHLDHVAYLLGEGSGELL